MLLLVAEHAHTNFWVLNVGGRAGIIELLDRAEEDLEDGEMSAAQLLRYQDPLSSMKSCLHMAIERSQQEAAWALLWLASDLPSAAFPEAVSQAAQAMGAERESTRGLDIRNLRDDHGRTAGAFAGSMGDTWAEMLGAGLLDHEGM